MLIQTWSLILALLSGTMTADTHVTGITIAAKGVLCLSCTYRLEKAIQRLEGVEKVRVRISPALAEVTPKAGRWIEGDRLRRAVQDAGFKPGEVRYTVTGALVEWQGQPAVRLSGGEQVIVLKAEPGASGAFERARKSISEAGGRTVEIEGPWVEEVGKRDRTVPEALRVHRLQDRE
jgi:copper chaperone CopZ